MSAKMKERQLDILFVEPNSSKQVYQKLANDFTAIETPTWSLLLAQSCRSKGIGVAILDCNAERLSNLEAIRRIAIDYNPRLVVFCVYGSNPNSGTTNMAGAISLCNDLKKYYSDIKTVFVGTHTSALPKEVLENPSVDIVLLNEGVYALRNLIQIDLSKKENYHQIKGIGYKDDDNRAILNEPEQIVPQHLMDVDLPGYAWDLLPFKNKPFDLYRSHIWHADFQDKYRNPSAAIYTSLGCQFLCQYCVINILNRINNDDNITSEHSNVMRFWSPNFIIQEFDKLAEYGVSTIRISDEMHLLNKKYYEPLHKLLIERSYNIKSWLYSRCDSINPRFLDQVRKAGIEWFAIGYESPNKEIRANVTKGTFKNIDFKEQIKLLENHGIKVIANFIVGLPGDNYETMNETKQAAFDMNADMLNVYPAMALPGTPLYLMAKQNGIKLPDSFEGFSFHSYECQPLPTDYLSAADILKFRDSFWNEYMWRPQYIDKVRSKFGDEAVQTIEKMRAIKLERKLLE